MRLLLLLLAALNAASALANDILSIDFDVSADAAACTPALSNNGRVDFNQRHADSLSTESFTQLGTREITLTVTCESSTAFAITSRDTRASSAISGADDKGLAGARFTVNGGEYVSSPSRLFGLGLTAEKRPVGSYAVQIIASDVTATEGDNSVMVDIAGASSQSGPWTKTTSLPLPTNQDYFYTFVQKGTLSPQPVSSASIPLQVSATVANRLNSREVIRLDGEAVISIVYL